MDRYETAAKAWYDDEVGDSWPELAKQLREHFPEPGRCGECRWRKCGVDETWKVYRCTEPTNLKMPTPLSTGPWLPADGSCPRFERRPDKYEELAREFYEPRHPRFTEELADFLRSSVTVREGE